MKLGKRYRECVAAYDASKTYDPAEALDVVIKNVFQLVQCV